MLEGFDHVIIGVGDLARAEADLRGIGSKVTARPDVGATETENRLICFQDGSYIEVFSFLDRTHPNQHRWAPLLAKGDGWLDYSVHVSDVTAETARLAASGLPSVGPRSGGRSLTAGRRWDVAVLLTGRGIANPVLRFLIEDTEPREVRVPGGAAAVQPAGVTAVVGVTLVTTALAAVETELAAMFGPGVAVTRSGAVAARRYGLAGRWVEVIEPTEADALDHLRARGEGVYEVTLGAPVTRLAGRASCWLWPRPTALGYGWRCNAPSISTVDQQKQGAGHGPQRSPSSVQPRH